jgi:hypothetical protein
MLIMAGKRQRLQIHESQIETYTLMRGRALLIIENSAEEMVDREFELGKGYTTKVGQRHRLVGVSDCDIFEAASPEIGTTLRLEDEARPDETEEVRAWAA